MQTQGGFVWTDESQVDYVNWDPGEPNGWNGATLEDHVAMVFFTEYSWNGAWNDADGSSDTNAYCADPSSWDTPNDPDTASWCRFGQNGYFPLCQVQPSAAPAPGSLVQYVWGTGATSSFRIQICVDHIDTIYFQDDRMWIAYGGQ